MSSGKKRIIIMAAAVLVMISVLLALVIDWSACSSDEHDHDHVSDADTSYDDVLLIDKNSDDQTEMVITNKNGAFHLRRKDNGDIEIAELSGIPQNHSFIEIAWDYAMTIGYNSVYPVTSSTDLAEYGFSDPLARVHSVYSDGSETGFTIGSQIPGTDDNYFVRVDGYDDSIYITEMDAVYFQGNRFWVSDDPFGYAGQENAPEIGAITLSGSALGSTVKIEPHTSPDKSDLFYGHDYVITSPYLCAADSYTMSQLTDELACLVANEAMCVRPTADQIAQYGLDKPYLVMTHQRNGKDFTIRISKADYNTLYMKIDGIDVIYRLDADSFPTIFGISLDNLRDIYAHVRYFETMSSISIDKGGEKYSFRLERKESTAGMYEYYSYCGDRLLNLSEYKSFLEVFNSATVAGYSSDETDEPPALTVTISYFDGLSRTQDIITYTPIQNRRYLCRINGSGSAVVTEMWIGQLMDAARKLVQE